MTGVLGLLLAIPEPFLGIVHRIRLLAVHELVNLVSQDLQVRLALRRLLQLAL